MAAASWRLRRNCSLTPRQTLAAWAVPVAMMLGVALTAAVQGWWWVVAFVLLDLAAVATALWRYARHALDGETLRLGDDGMLVIEQRCGTEVRHFAWRASLVRLEATERGAPITLRAGTRRVEIGAQAKPAERELAAQQLQQALRGGAVR